MMMHPKQTSWAVGIALCSLFLPMASGAFGNSRAHPRLAEGAYERADADLSLHDYFRDFLSLQEGGATLLDLRLGFDEDIDREVRLERFLDPKTSNEEEMRFKAEGLQFNFGDSCESLIPESCPPAGSQADLLQLLRVGVATEDIRNARAQHHFHDPVREHAPPDGNAGLDNVVDGGIDVFAAEWFTTFVRGGFIVDDPLRTLGSLFLSPLASVIPGIDPDVGHFDLRGRGAMDRALNRSTAGEARTPSEASPMNFFALPDTERYLYRGLTAPSEVERRHYLGLHVLSFGHVLHLLQDMGSVAHTRNDFILDHIVGHKTGLEVSADDDKALPLIPLGDPRLTSAELLANQSRKALVEANVDGALLGEFSETLPSLDVSGFDLGDYWETGILDSGAIGEGLAQFVNRSFLSLGTVSNDISEPGRGYPNPVLPRSCDPTIDGPGTGPAFVTELPYRDLAGVSGIAGEDDSLYLSSTLTPRLARCRFHHESIRANVPILEVQPDWLFSVEGPDIHRDYLEALFPITIDVTAKMLDQYFSPRVAVVPIGGGSFRLANRTEQLFVARTDAIEIVYDGVDGERHVVGADCSGFPELVLGPAPELGGQGTVSGLICSMPASVDVDPLSATDFLVIARGQLGSRGTLAEPDATNHSNEWKSKDYVVVVDHVRDSLIYASSEVVAENAGSSDLARAVDLYRVEIEPEIGIPLDALSAPVDSRRGYRPLQRVKLTDLYRQVDMRPDLDFASPTAILNDARVVLRSDRFSPPDPTSNRTDVQAPLDLYFFDPQTDPQFPSNFEPIPDSRIADDISDDLRILQAHATSDGEALFFFVGETEPAALARWRSSDAATIRFVSDLGLTSRIPVETPSQDLVVGDEHALCSGAVDVSALSDTQVAVVANCEAGVVHMGPTGPVIGVTDRSRQIFLMNVGASGVEPGLLDGLFVQRINMATNRFESCGGAGQECWQFEPDDEISPVLSPDGQRVAFLVDRADVPGPDTTLYVANIADGSVREVFASSTTLISSPTWSPSGRHIAFILFEPGVECTACEAFVVDADVPGPQIPRQITRGAGLNSSMTWLKPGLSLPEAL